MKKIEVDQVYFRRRPPERTPSPGGTSWYYSWSSDEDEDEEEVYFDARSTCSICEFEEANSEIFPDYHWAPHEQRLNRAHDNNNRMQNRRNYSTSQNIDEDCFIIEEDEQFDDPLDIFPEQYSALHIEHDYNPNAETQEEPVQQVEETDRHVENYNLVSDFESSENVNNSKYEWEKAKRVLNDEDIETWSIDSHVEDNNLFSDFERAKMRVPNEEEIETWSFDSHVGNYNLIRGFKRAEKRVQNVEEIETWSINSDVETINLVSDSERSENNSEYEWEKAKGAQDDEEIETWSIDGHVENNNLEIDSTRENNFDYQWGSENYDELTKKRQDDENNNSEEYGEKNDLNYLNFSEEANSNYEAQPENYEWSEQTIDKESQLINNNLDDNHRSLSETIKTNNDIINEDFNDVSKFNNISTPYKDKCNGHLDNIDITKSDKCDKSSENPNSFSLREEEYKKLTNCIKEYLPKKNKNEKRKHKLKKHCEINNNVENKFTNKSNEDLYKKCNTKKLCEINTNVENKVTCKSYEKLHNYKKHYVENKVSKSNEDLHKKHNLKKHCKLNDNVENKVTNKSNEVLLKKHNSMKRCKINDNTENKISSKSNKELLNNKKRNSKKNCKINQTVENKVTGSPKQELLNNKKHNFEEHCEINNNEEKTVTSKSNEELLNNKKHGEINNNVENTVTCKSNELHNNINESTDISSKNMKSPLVSKNLVEKSNISTTQIGESDKLNVPESSANKESNECKFKHFKKVIILKEYARKQMEKNFTETSNTGYKSKETESVQRPPIERRFNKKNSKGTDDNFKGFTANEREDDVRARRVSNNLFWEEPNMDLARKFCEVYNSSSETNSFTEITKFPSKIPEPKRSRKRKKRKHVRETPSEVDDPTYEPQVKRALPSKMVRVKRRASIFQSYCEEEQEQIEGSGAQIKENKAIDDNEDKSNNSSGAQIKENKAIDDNEDKSNNSSGSKD